MSKFKGFKAKKTNTGLKLVLGAIAAVLTLIIGLGSVVVMDNNKICSEIGLSGFVFDACYGKSGQSFDKVAIVVGNTANTPEPTIRKEIQGYIAASLIKEESSIEVYSVTPDKKKFFIKNNIDTDGNLEDRVHAVREMLDDISKKIATEPTVSGAQYLETIIRAARNMALTGKEKGVVIVIGSGLSDGGILNFADNDLFGNNSETPMTIEELMSNINPEDNPSLPTNLLKNTTVVWSGLGEVALPQVELEPRENERLQEIYKAVFSRNGLGADKFILKNGADNTESIKTNKTVKVVDVWPTTVDLRINFKESSAAIEDKEEVEEALEGLVKRMMSGKIEKVTIEGYVGLANCNSNADTSLSQRRAEAVKKLITKRGISGNRVEAIGRGKGPENECIKGVYNPPVAARNKFVRVTAK